MYVVQLLNQGHISRFGKVSTSTKMVVLFKNIDKFGSTTLVRK